MTVPEVLSLVVAFVALVVGLLALARSGRSRRPGPEDSLPEDVVGLRQEVAALRAEGRQALRHVAIVRYDAFGDMGGHVSWSLALLDATGTGVLLTSIHGRSDARSYAKTVTEWHSTQPLSPEEQAALDQARP